jgi:YD repeat-containing protein
MRTEIDRPDIPLGEILDSAGRVLTSKKQDGAWVEYTRDAAGHVVKCQRSTGRVDALSEEIGELIGAPAP